METQSLKIYDLIVVGGGASGFFGAIHAAEMKPGLKILILEKSNKLLAKVKISGGGRCNVTHHCFDPVKLSRHYPRGEKQLKNVFKQYQARQTMEWFKGKGVDLKTEEDGRMFPVTNNAQTIIDCFIQQALKNEIKIEMGEGVERIHPAENGFQVHTGTGNKFCGKRILITTGGNPNPQFYQWIAGLGHTIIAPIPSLFTFNDPERKFADLMGVSVPGAEVKIAGTKFSQQGPMLITHWGLSGPAVIKLSAWAADYLHSVNYDFTALVSWVGSTKEEQVRSLLTAHKEMKTRQKITTNPMFSLPQRLWWRICELSEIEEHKIWAELPQRNLNKLIEFLIRCPFNIRGKTTFKEEFVTCGGVDMREVNIETMESRKLAGVYFAGEVLNLDGETGGFNFQAAWSTAFVAAKGVISSFH